MKNYKNFTSEILIIGINPFVFLPEDILEHLFIAAKKDKGHIPVKLVINKVKFIQNLVKYSGAWKLYLNKPMRKAAGKETGDQITISIAFDTAERTVVVNKDFISALNKNKAALKTFNALPPSRQKEINRYISSLKTEESIQRNINRALNFLSGKGRFIGRDKP